MRKLTTEDFIKKAIEVHGNKYDYSLVNYSGCKNKIIIVCPIHGEFKQTPDNHLIGNGCYYCSLLNNAKKLRKPYEEFISIANKIHNNKYDYSRVNYVNNKTKIIINCPIHGEFKQTPDKHISLKNGCPKCAIDGRKITQTKTLISFIQEAEKIHNNKYDYSKLVYINNKTKVEIICKEHGLFKQTPDNHLKGKGCPICKESKGENKIREFLKNENIIFISQHKFKDCVNIKPLPFDFYLPEYNTCIEYQGRQHYEPIDFFGGANGLNSTLKRDKIKSEYCKENNIKLMIIKHSDNTIQSLVNYFHN
jgi:Protein of unknown function (DUF723)